jgi:hypothetical protein
MSKFKDWDDRAYDVVRFREPEQEPDPEVEDVLANDDEDTEEDQYLAEYDVATGILKELTPTLDEEGIKELYTRDAQVAEYPLPLTLLS